MSKERCGPCRSGRGRGSRQGLVGAASREVKGRASSRQEGTLCLLRLYAVVSIVPYGTVTDRVIVG